MATNYVLFVCSLVIFGFLTAEALRDFHIDKQRHPGLIVIENPSPLDRRELSLSREKRMVVKDESLSRMKRLDDSGIKSKPEMMPPSPRQRVKSHTYGHPVVDGAQKQHIHKFPHANRMPQEPFILKETDDLMGKQMILPPMKSKEVEKHTKAKAHSLSRAKRLKTELVEKWHPEQMASPQDEKLDSHSKTHLSREKRLDNDREALSRTKRLDEGKESLSRTKRLDDEKESLSRTKRLDGEKPSLSRMKRLDDDEASLSRKKRLEEEEASWSRAKRLDKDKASLSRMKRVDEESNPQPHIQTKKDHAQSLSKKEQHMIKRRKYWDHKHHRSAAHMHKPKHDQMKNANDVTEEEQKKRHKRDA